MTTSGAGIRLSEVFGEYRDACERVMAAVSQFDSERCVRTARCGDEYSSDGLVVYQYYGHKREHWAQLALASDERSQAETWSCRG